MESLILRSNPVTLTSQLHSVAAGEAFLTDAIVIRNGSNLGDPGMRFFYKITMGASLPGASSLDFYLLFGDGDTLIDAGAPPTNTVLDGASTPLLVDVMRHLPPPTLVIPLENAISKVYQGSFFIPLDAGNSVSILIFNNSASALSATAGHHKLTYGTARPSSA